MPVISLVSSKGGVGKTTSAVVLAGEFAAAGRKVVLVDADPNRPLEAWARLRALPETMRVVTDDSAETIIDTIEDARAGADFVIVDLEGTATDRIGFAVARSDLVLIPLQSSVLDAAEAAKSVKLVRQMWKVANREIPYRAFYTRVPPAIRERTARDIERQFSDAEIPTLPATLIDRAAYRALFSLGGTLHELESADVSGLNGARENARNFAQTVINTLRGGAA
ncbi:ATPase involved in chromosome partitioning-like protein (plasmid) [Pseudorhizobium banfieldiae]|uniref:ATPase involved in chromosome partitioning-like protein n=1 Tax=Pseudorhizobium banfieldiae TaxID=1125847 RepID=L0NNS2_9HYPH|nr:ParA family protein [Pseudorhizobium banfieldiae]CAD6631774.1 chromosome partitioning protein [arsenite-oxidising bacterium NT-25]CCF22397.1 ATPase involved in chromosome partitioning-like protein [Pseudorhizobium banfieldiae]